MKQIGIVLIWTMLVSAYNDNRFDFSGLRCPRIVFVIAILYFQVNLISRTLPAPSSQRHIALQQWAEENSVDPDRMDSNTIHFQDQFGT